MLSIFSFVSATTTYGNNITDDTGLTLNGFVDSIGYVGVFIEPTTNLEVISVGRTNYGNSTNAYIILSGGQIVAQASFVEDTATFSPYPTLTAGTRYGIVCGNDDESAIHLNYVASVYSFPIVGTNLNYVGGINTMATLSEMYYWNNPSDVVADVQNITTRNITNPVTNGAPLHYDNLITSVEQTQLPNTTIQAPVSKFSIFQGINNFFMRIGNWFSKFFGFL